MACRASSSPLLGETPKAAGSVSGSCRPARRKAQAAPSAAPGGPPPPPPPRVRAYRAGRPAGEWWAGATHPAARPSSSDSRSGSGGRPPGPVPGSQSRSRSPPSWRRAAAGARPRWPSGAPPRGTEPVPWAPGVRPEASGKHRGRSTAVEGPAPTPKPRPGASVQVKGREGTSSLPATPLPLPRSSCFLLPGQGVLLRPWGPRGPARRPSRALSPAVPHPLPCSHALIASAFRALGSCLEPAPWTLPFCPSPASPSPQPPLVLS